MKNVIKNKSMWFLKKLYYTIQYKFVSFENIYKFSVDCFFIGVIYFLLFIKNVFINIKNSIFPPKYARYENVVKKQNYLSQTDLQHWY